MLGQPHWDSIFLRGGTSRAVWQHVAAADSIFNQPVGTLFVLPALCLPTQTVLVLPILDRRYTRPSFKRGCGRGD